MGYSKAIICGDTLEFYTYEKDIRSVGGKRGSVQSRNKLSDLAQVAGAERDAAVQKRRDNQRRAELAFRRLVLANVFESDPPLLVTCTYSENQTDLGVGYSDFKAFIGNLRYRWGRSFRYIVVPEFQKRGAVHFHALFWGLPQNLCKEERYTRLVASLWGRGFVDVFQTDGSDKLSSYLAKYMGKSYSDHRLFGFKAYRCSRNVFRPKVESYVSLWYLQEAYLGGVDNFAFQDREYMTQWLGKGRYRVYKFNSKINGN